MDSASSTTNSQALPTPVIKVDPKTLKPHPLNSPIYGEEENVEDLVELISQSGWIKPLVVTTTDQIISGHRRWKAALQLGLDSIPVEVREFQTELHELEALLLENATRIKTTEQKVREANAWKDIEAEKAKLRKIVTQNNDTGRAVAQEAEVANLPPLVESKGKVRDIIAARVGLRARNYEKAAKVVEFIDSETVLGNFSQAAALRQVLNKSVDAAYQLIKKPHNTRSQILTLLAGGKSLREALSRQRRQSTSTLNQSDDNCPIETQDKEAWRSCWNCQHRGESIDNQSFYCYMNGAISCISDLSARASECDYFRERTMPPDKAGRCNSSLKTCTYQLNLPCSWQEKLESHAAESGMSVEEWIKLLVANQLFPPTVMVSDFVLEKGNRSVFSCN